MTDIINPTTDILWTIGSPFIVSAKEKCTLPTTRLYSYAVKNRVAFHYLEAIRGAERPGILKEKTRQLKVKVDKTQQAFIRISSLLEESNIDFAFFKTVRPYSEVTVDIDILVFGNDYYRAIKALKKSGCIVLVGNSIATTLRDFETRLNVDVYNEIVASHVVYLDKARLRGFISKRKIANNEGGVLCLNPIADLLCIISHSVIKEQLYVLSEYITNLHYLKEMKKAEIDEFLRLTDECKLRSAVSTHFTITALIHNSAHGFYPWQLLKIIDYYGLNNIESKRIVNNCFLMPHRYHLTTFVQALIEKLQEKKARRSFGKQVLNMLNPAFASEAIHRIQEHITREAY